MTTIDIPELFTAAEVAAKLKVTPQHVRRLIKKEIIPSAVVAGRIVVTAEQLKWYLEKELSSTAKGGAEAFSKPSGDGESSARALASGHRTKRKLIG